MKFSSKDWKKIWSGDDEAQAEVADSPPQPARMKLF